MSFSTISVSTGLFLRNTKCNKMLKTTQNPIDIMNNGNIFNILRSKHNLYTNPTMIGVITTLLRLVRGEASDGGGREGIVVGEEGEELQQGKQQGRGLVKVTVEEGGVTVGIGKIMFYLYF